jgi:uncharacterized iron-regulated protein
MAAKLLGRSHRHARLAGLTLRPAISSIRRMRTCWVWALAVWSVGLGGCTAQHVLRPPGGFTQTLGRAHPLSGRVWDVSRHELSTPSGLLAALERAAFVVLGETHDNRDHHLLQAELLQHFAATHEHAAVAFEMLDENQASELGGAGTTADALAARVHWSASGWPPFELYRPVFEAAIAARAHIVAAHPSAAHVRASMAGVSEIEARALHLDRALPPQQQEAQRDEIRAGHCGQAPDAMVSAMQRAQSYKDAFMARALVQSGPPTLLVAGRGHARGDRGVPLFLRRFGIASVLSVAFVEVEDERTRALDYDIAAFDFVVFTPRVTDEDACERFKRQLESMRGQHGAAAAPSAVHDPAGSTSAPNR